MSKRKRIFLIAFAVILLGSLSFLLGKRGEGKIIPKGRMARIYEDMLMTDQWINSNISFSRMADTSFVYRPILEAYGYTEADWRYSLSHYIKDPDRFSRILKKTASRLEARVKYLERIEEARKELLAKKADTIDAYPKRIFYLAGLKNPDNFVQDSLVFYVDSVGSWEWTFDPYKGYDTLFNGPFLKITLDSLQIDSCAVSDSLCPLEPFESFTDTLKVSDSKRLRKFEPDSSVKRRIDDNVNRPAVQLRAPRREMTPMDAVVLDKREVKVL